MKYTILGAGGTGGSIAFYMAKAGKDVTLLARGKHLAAIQAKGLTMHRIWCDETESIPVKAVSTEDYRETPNVIFVCVKYYSLDGIVPFLARAAGPETVIVPILNVFGTGSRLQERLPDLHVLDGCIYVSAEKEAPGVLKQHGSIMRVVFGERGAEGNPQGGTSGRDFHGVLEQIRQDLSDSGITPVLSDNIGRDCLAKFSYVSALGAAGLYYRATVGDFQKEGKPKEMFQKMIREIMALSHAMGCALPDDMLETNMRILAGIAPSGTTSMQRDIAEGKASEVDGLVYEVVRLGDKYGVPTPAYDMAAQELRSRGLK